MPNYSKRQHRWKFANLSKSKARKAARHTPGGYSSLPETSKKRKKSKSRRKIRKRRS